MFITIEELYSMKKKYLAELRAVEAKLAVVDDFIGYAQSKEPIVTEETEVVESENVEQPAEAVFTDC